MKTLKSFSQQIIFVTSAIAAFFAPFRSTEDESSLSPIYNFSPLTIDGEVVDLSNFHGKTLLIVNTASECGFTPQYEELEKIYWEFKNKGLVVLGFPSNDFGAQEPGTDQQIKEFCQSRFKVTFPLFQKGAVTGKEIQPLFRFLTESANISLAGSIKWNFEKFLINKRGCVVGRYTSFVSPISSKLRGDIAALL